MSRQGLRAFIDDARQDNRLGTSLKQIRAEAAKRRDGGFDLQYLKQLIELAASVGYEVTLADLDLSGMQGEEEHEKPA
jgi:hypothetical protein